MWLRRGQALPLTQVQQAQSIGGPLEPQVTSGFQRDDSGRMSLKSIRQNIGASYMLTEDASTNIGSKFALTVMLVGIIKSKHLATLGMVCLITLWTKLGS